MSLIKKCDGCDQMIAMMKTKKGNFIPVNIESLDEREIEDLKRGFPRSYLRMRHETHFINCPGADKFRRK